MSTCRTCDHWRTPPVAGVTLVSGKCSRVLDLVSVAGGIAQPGALVVPAEFGCVLHSAGQSPAVAHARRGDPDESHAAARSITRLNDRRMDVLATLGQATHPLTDRELVVRYSHANGRIPQSASGLRTRRAELVTMGLVVRTGHATIGSRKHATWYPTEAGRAALATTDAGR